MSDQTGSPADPQPAASGADTEAPTSVPISERSILALIQYLSLLETGSGLHTEKLTDDQEGLVKELVSQLFAHKDEPVSAELQSWAKIQKDSAFSTLSPTQVKVIGLGSTFAAFFPTIAGGLGGDIAFENIQVPEAQKADFENRVKPNVEYLNGLEGSTVATEFIKAIAEDDIFVNKLFARLEGSGFSAPSGAETGLANIAFIQGGGFEGENAGFNPSGGFSQGGSGGQVTNTGFGNNANNSTGQGMNTGFGNNANSTTGQFNPGSQGFTGGINSGNSNQQYTGGSGQWQQPGSTGFGGGVNQGFSSGNQHTSGGSGQWQPQTNFGGNQPQTGGNTNYYNGNGFNPNNPYIPTKDGYVPATGQFINQGQTMQNYNGMMGSDIPKFPGPKQGSGQQPPKGSVPDIITPSRPSPRFGGRGGPKN